MGAPDGPRMDSEAFAPASWAHLSGAGSVSSAPRAFSGGDRTGTVCSEQQCGAAGAAGARPPGDALLGGSGPPGPGLGPSRARVCAGVLSGGKQASQAKGSLARRLEASAAGKGRREAGPGRRGLGEVSGGPGRAPHLGALSAHMPLTQLTRKIRRCF